ncbi:hypothetical protein Asi02nite_77020 [Asanoa siamensis]|uniref:Uncharacterized protein n=2 Tax=Asanoa siamensis TaxID=926357 RepID=A0ABQ4D3S3_9ACTN|nr:hypothetical protein Asi02nite_77020 [Asanoa siamensis]
MANCETYDAFGGRISFKILPVADVCDESLLVYGEIRRGNALTSSAYLASIRCGEQVSTLNVPAQAVTDAGVGGLLDRMAAQMR